jgi:hypothetical protein
MNEFHPLKQAPRSSSGRTTTRYSTVLPFLIVLVTLILSTGKDIVILYKRKILLVEQNARAAEPLKKAGKQAEFIDSLKADLIKLSPADPVAARIVTEFFTPPSAPKQMDQAAQPPLKTPGK